MPIVRKISSQASREESSREQEEQDCPVGKNRSCQSSKGHPRKTSTVTSVDTSIMLSCSQQSIFSAMDRFVKAVNNVSATVLVPSKLRDMEIPGRKVSRRIPPALANTDLYSFYVMIHEVKKELLWGPTTGMVAAATTITTSMPVPSSGRCTPRTSTVTAPSFLMEPNLLLKQPQQLQQSQNQNHHRQPSDDSLRSLGSTASSGDPDTDSEVDSLLTDRTDRESMDEHTSHLATAFRHHLQGLHTILHQLADSADYLSLRYQEEIDACSF
jgi:hypothetical protein